jgi:hypothetical protein
MLDVWTVNEIDPNPFLKLSTSSIHGATVDVLRANFYDSGVRIVNYLGSAVYEFRYRQMHQ